MALKAFSKCTLTLVAVMALWASSAAASEPSARRKPFFPPKHSAAMHATTLPLERYQQPMTVVRRRTEGMRAAVFVADAQPIEHGSIALIEAHSISSGGSIPRFRCIARSDIAECLGAPVKITYLPDDEMVVLTVTLKPERELAALTRLAGLLILSRENPALVD